MNSIPVDSYAEQIHLFEPWTPPSYNKKRKSYELVEEASCALSEHLDISRSEKPRPRFELVSLMNQWKPQPGDPVNTIVTKALLSQRRYQQVVHANDPRLALKCMRKQSFNYSADALVEYTENGNLHPATRLAGPDAYLDYEVIKAQLGRALQPCEAVAMRGYCLASKYLILAENPKIGTTFEQERAELQAFYANIFQTVREIGARTVVLSPMIYTIDEESAVRTCLAQVKQELAQSPGIEHVVLYTGRPTKLRKYTELLEQLEAVDK